MSVVYVVRCNFSEPSKEWNWNDWYSGPKIKQMLAKPFFRTCQRFRKSAGTGRNYLALWLLDSFMALNTNEYTSDWGFFEWRPYITDWSRDLFGSEGRKDAEFAVLAQGALQVVSFDDMSAANARTARAEAEQSLSGMIWLPIVGLDRHTPVIGLRPLSDITTAQLSGAPLPAGVQETIYRPISDFHLAEQTVPA